MIIKYKEEEMGEEDKKARGGRKDGVGGLTSHCGEPGIYE